MNTNSSSSRYPFTPSQWQELEQQALIYKYMATGIPIPSDLLLPLKQSSFFLTSTQPPPTTGWSSACYHIGGYGLGRRAAEDPEPGRCRRTDGKKWRCSKEAFADSKYCERHMHRGKNRSRKPVEISLNSATAAAAAVKSSIISGINASNPCTLLYPHSSWELRPLELGEPRQREREEERGKHCFVLGADFKMERPVRERDFLSFDVNSSSSSSTSTQPSPSPSPSSSSSSNSNYSKTQLSISIPMGLHDFPHWLVSCICRDENERIVVAWTETSEMKAS